MPEQKMIVRYLTGNEKVLELGGDIGHKSLIISSILGENSRMNFVSLESNINTSKQLCENRDINSLYFHVEPYALSKRNLIQKGHETKVSDVLLDGYSKVNTITFAELIFKYNIEFDTLVLDCEGAFYYILMDMPEILTNINLIIMENDYWNYSNKQYIDDTLKKQGFYVDYQEEGGWGPCYHNFYQVWKKNINEPVVNYKNNSRCQIYFNGDIVKKFPPNEPFIWNGKYSLAKVNGSIINYVETYLKKIKKNILFIAPLSDGNIQSKDIEDLNISYVLQKFSNKNSMIIGTLSQKTEDPNYKYLYLPLDDDFFQFGTSHFFPPETLPIWDKRKPIAFWRGGCSGGGMESARCRTVGKLIDYQHADAKCLSRYGWSNGKNIPDIYFGNEVHYTEYMKYKFVLIIDGNVIASSHMWSFAIGSVPILISNGICWFSKFLKPYENYVPINYDLSNLKETIEWLLKNDDKAKQIAENALRFSKEYFSSEFQKKYIEENINNLL
jgi:FkbM family methyltransferase